MRHFALAAFCIGFWLVALGTDDFIQRRKVQTLTESYVDLLDKYVGLDDEFAKMTEHAQNFCGEIKKDRPYLSSVDCNFGLADIRIRLEQIRATRKALPADWKGQSK